MGNGSIPEDFDVTKYVHDRAHELELNKFTHALEVEQLKLLILLNGGAAAALLTFAERATYPMTREGLLYPVLLWLAGLSAAAAATIIMRRLQAGYTSAYRHRRQATEWRQFEKENGPRPHNVLGPPDEEALRELRQKEDEALEAVRARLEQSLPEQSRPEDEKLIIGLLAVYARREEGDVDYDDVDYDKVATLLGQKAGRKNKWIFRLSLLSIGLFLAGALMAASVATSS